MTTEIDPESEPADDDLVKAKSEWFARKTGLGPKGRTAEVQSGRLVPFTGGGQAGYLFRAGEVRRWAEQHQRSKQKDADQDRRRKAAKRGRKGEAEHDHQ